MEKQNYAKYEYVPDVSHIMRHAGYDLDLMGILRDAEEAKIKKFNSSTNCNNRKNQMAPPFTLEVFYYYKSDING